MINKRKRVASTVLLGALFVALASCRGCEKQTSDFIDQAAAAFCGSVVTIPQTDSTPPVATLKMPDLGSGVITLGTGQPDVTIPLTEANSGFFIIGVGDDPEGVKEVDLKGGGEINCSNGSGLASRTFVDGLTVSNISPNRPGQTTCSRREVIHQINVKEWTGCPDAGFHVTSATVDIHAEATNFSGGRSSTAVARFTYTAPSR